jgi:hypothetical protein
MLGFALTVLFAIGAMGAARITLRRALQGFDPAVTWALCGLIGLGGVGLLTFFLGLFRTGLDWGIWVVAAVAVAGYVDLFQYRHELAFRVPRDARLLAWMVAALGLVLALFGVLAPSTTLDWDSLAYHLAVPNLWLAAQRIEFISFIHHSNFPFAIDNLYIWGLRWGGESGAKAFSWFLSLLAGLGTFGFARQRYGEAAGYWSLAAFWGTPAVLWLSGTAYVDVAQGAYVGFGVWMAALWLEDRANVDKALLGGILLGLGAASKYTGIQAVLLVAIVLVGFRGWRSWRVGIWLPALAIAISAPWLIRNIVNTGNPVYPFFYEQLGGKNWSEFNARIYRHEQQTFGAGRAQPTPEQPDYVKNPLDPTRIGAAVLGLAYQPGRYINPGPIGGNGLPIGALGFVGLGSLLLWLVIGRDRTVEKDVLFVTGLSLLAWFFLSQQSRYIIGVFVPWWIMAGGAVVLGTAGRLLAAGIAAQAGYALWLISQVVTIPQARVVLGQETPQEYLQRNVSFAEPAAWMNENLPEGAKVALYDEVFGFLLDREYLWANPGHTTELGYAEAQTAEALAGNLRRMGVTHVYLTLGPLRRDDPALAEAWIAATGLNGPATPLPGEIRERLMADEGARWRVLLADAIAEGTLRLVHQTGTRFTFELQR